LKIASVLCNQIQAMINSFSFLIDVNLAVTVMTKMKTITDIIHQKPCWSFMVLSINWFASWSIGGSSVGRGDPT